MTKGGQALLATASKDATVRLWDGSTGACLGVGKGHIAAVSAVAFSRRDARYLVSGGVDKTLQVMLFCHRSYSVSNSVFFGFLPFFPPIVVLVFCLKSSRGRALLGFRIISLVFCLQRSRAPVLQRYRVRVFISCVSVVC